MVKKSSFQIKRVPFKLNYSKNFFQSSPFTMSPFLDVTMMFMATVPFRAQLDSGILCL